MALDPEKYESIRDLVETAVGFAPVDEEQQDEVADYVTNLLLGDLESLIDESRPPRLYVFGPTGAGKSSLINALANKDKADVGDIEPETADSKKYTIQFPERYANWEVVDSRGLFESQPADSENPDWDASDLAEEFEKYQPDVALHVTTPDQLRAGEQAFRAIETLSEEITGGLPPLIYCINKVDQHTGPTGAWPPEESQELASTITENLDVAADLLDEETRTPFKQTEPWRGYLFESETHIGVFPTYALEEPYWNVETLAELIGKELPDEAVLQFAQAQRRESLMRNVARRRTQAIAASAGTIGAADISGFSDIVVLTPLQITLVMLIASFSCEELSIETAKEYFAEIGAVGGAGLAARKLAGALAGTIPIGGQAINGAVASSTTYAIGRSAESYFFDGPEFETPADIIGPNGVVDRFKDMF